MQQEKVKLLKSYISNLQVNVTMAYYTKCHRTWREMDYIPEYNKFYFICEGEGWLKMGDREYFPKPGQLFLMPQGVMQSFSTISDNTFGKYWCHFTARVGDKNLFDIIKLPYFTDVRNPAELTVLFEEMASCFQSDSLTSTLQLKAALLQVIAFYIENTVIEDIHLVSSASVEKLTLVLTYIDGHISEDITVEQLAELLHFHPNYFIRFFKAHMGSSPMHYINKIKLEKARELLEVTGMNISEVAEASGFKDLFYFSRMFKNYTGFSPSEYKNKAR
mgnify:CR=1 FL=1